MIHKYSELSEDDLLSYSGGGTIEKYGKKALKSIPYGGAILSGINHAGTIENGVNEQQKQIDKRNQQLKNN